MIDPRTEELINAAIDGELSHDDEQELQRRLADSPDARQLQAELSQLDSMLKRLPQQEAPATLHENITTAVELPATPSAAVPVLASWPGVARYGLAAALGGLAVALSFFSTQGMWQDPAEYDQLVGTIAPTPGGKIELLQIEQISNPAPELAAEVSLSQRGRQYIVEMEIDSESVTDLRLSVAQELQFEALAQTFNQLEEFTVADNAITARSQGKHRFALLFRDSTGGTADRISVNVVFMRDGSVIERISLVHE